MAADGTRWVAAASAQAAPPSSQVFLLGTYDELLVAFRDLRNVLADGRPSTELLTRPIVIDGRTIGSWTRRLARRELTVEMVLRTVPTPAQREALQAAADRLGAFVGLPATLALRAP